MSKRSRRWDNRTIAQQAQEQSAKAKAKNQGKDPEVTKVTDSDGVTWLPSISYPTLTFTPGASVLNWGGRPHVKEEDLPHREQIDTLRVFKLAKLVLANGIIRLQGVGTHAIYDVDAVAECHAGMDGMMIVGGDEKVSEQVKHTAPELNCTCGFYGVPHKHAKEVQSDYATSRYVRIEAELFGRIVKHERGYRAQRQRVMSISVPRKCRTLGAATGSWATSSGGEVQCENTPLGMRLDGGYIVPSCAEHAFGGVVPLPDVARQVGVQVRWAE